MDAQYRILFTGKLLPGKDLQDVARRMAKKFRMREETARDLILSGAGRVLKHNLDAEGAERFRAALTAAGLAIIIEPQDASQPHEDESMLSPYPSPPAADPITLSKPPADRPSVHQGASAQGGSTCPKCGADEVSDITGVCQVCGVVAERYLASHQAGAAGAATENPYAPPRSDLTPPPWTRGQNDGFRDPRSVDAGRGLGWILDAWALFKEQPGVWIGILVLFYLIVIVMSLVPLIGSLATVIIGPMLSAGILMGAHAQYRGEGVTLGHLFAGMQQKPGPLAMVGLLYLVLAIGIGILIALIFFLMMGSGAVVLDGANLDPQSIDAGLMTPIMMLPLLIGLLLGLPLAMAMFFAPALVALDDLPVPRAFRLSFLGCLKNILPFLVFGVVALLLVIAGSIPLLLGLLVVVPLLAISVYCAYRDIFHA